jgi:hypothetical protein
MLNYESLLIPEGDSKELAISETMVVVTVYPKRNAIWLLPYITIGELATKRPDAKPQQYDLSMIESQIKQGNITLDELELESYKNVPEEYLYDKNGEQLPSAVERDRRFKIVEKAISFEDELFYSIHGKGVIAKLVKEFRSTRSNVQRYLNEYFRGGRHINSLIPKTGRHSSSAKPGGKKIGAIRLTASIGVVGKNVDGNDLEKIRRIAKKHYQNKKLKSLKKCFGKLLDEEYYLVKGKVLPDGSRVKTVHLPPNEQITIGQFYYWLPVALGMSRNDINTERRQQATHKSNFAGRTGDVAYNSRGPGEIFQMDSTEIDIEIVSPYDRQVRLSKVTLYVVRDVYTRAIVGIHIASGKASWYEARLALLNTFRDKVIVAKEWGLNIAADDFIEGGIPLILLVDNEELANKISASVGKDLGMIVQFSRAYSGDDKGLVESSFHMLHAMMRNEELAGFQYKGLIGRNRQLPKQTAALTPREIQQILMIYAIYHNRCIWKDDYPLEEAAMNDGVKDVCRDYWIWGMKNRPYYLRQKPLRTLYLSLLEVGVLTVHKTHLHLLDTSLKYKCTDIRVAGIQNKISGNGVKPVLSCRYIRSTVGKIFIELNGELVIGEIHSNQRRYRNLSHAEFAVASKEQTIKEQMHNHDVSGERSDMSLRIGHINKQAIKTRDNFIASRSNTSLLDTKTATQLQIDESYAIDNEMFGRLTDAPPTKQNEKQPEEEILLESPENQTDESLTKADEKSINVLENILKEMNNE